MAALAIASRTVDHVKATVTYDVAGTAIPTTITGPYIRITQPHPGGAAWVKVYTAADGPQTRCVFFHHAYHIDLDTTGDSQCGRSSTPSPTCCTSRPCPTGAATASPPRCTAK